MTTFKQLKTGPWEMDSVETGKKRGKPGNQAQYAKNQQTALFVTFRLADSLPHKHLDD